MFIKCWFENDISQHYKTSSNNNSPQTMGLWWLDGTTVSMDDLSPPGPGALMMFHLPNGNSTRNGESIIGYYWITYIYINVYTYIHLQYTIYTVYRQ